MLVSDFGAINIVAFKTLFCFAPTSSSPSTSKIFWSDLLTTLSSGTEPPSEISLTVSAPAALRHVLLQMKMKLSWAPLL